MKPLTLWPSAHTLLTIFVWLCLVVLADPSFAAKHSQVGTTMCTMASWFNGNAGRGIATIAIFTLGAAASLGKITWGTAAVVGVGIAAIFGADYLVLTLGGFNCGATFT